MAVGEHLRIAPLDEPKAGRLTIQYGPDAETRIAENPPRFTWLPVLEPEARYVLRVSSSADYDAPNTTIYPDIALNFFTPDHVFAAGVYYWSYAVWDTDTCAPATAWSSSRTFSIGEKLPETPLALRSVRLAATKRSHPRLWLDEDAVMSFRSRLKSEPDFCAFDTFFEKSAKPWLDHDVMREPVGYPDHQRTAAIWRKTYIECQELLYAVRHMAVAGKITGDTEMIGRAKAWLLEAASWNPAGTTSRAYTDEWAFRVNLALAWGYDWLHDVLTDDERARVRTALVARTNETANHVIKSAKIQLFPFDSHAVRAVSAVIIPASIALLHDEEQAVDWLNYAIEFLMTVYSPWGDSDGGWAEGPHYWMTGLAYLIDAANLLKSYTEIDIYRRPFFQNTGDFPFYCRPPDTRRATFCDDATQGDTACLKLGYNMRQFAGVTGKPHYAWYLDEVKQRDPGTEKAFYNWGWWDLNFDDMVYRHDFEAVEGQVPRDLEKLRWFRGIGWAGIQHQPHVEGEHIHFVTKSSPYGSISHSHADQNAFCLSAFGEDLAIQSGYYVAFGSTMHKDWRRQTRSKNAILIDGKGQYAGDDKARAIRASGRIVAAEDRGDHVFIRGDATAAYAEENPVITRVLRDTYFVHDSFFVFVDYVDADSPVTLDWLLHANGPMELGAETFRYRGARAGFYGQALYSEAGVPTVTQETGFPGVDPADYDGLAVSTCLNVTHAPSRRHRIATLIVPYPLAEPRRVFSFLDDQGYAANLYFTDADDRSFKIAIEKSFEPGGRP